MMSEGALTEPINPDYMPPKAEISYEVEVANEGTRWVRAWIGNEKFTKDIERAEEIRVKMIRVGYKARIIRVETIRSQMP